ncbi:7TM domain-containing protein [Altererythrobacter sp. GH1-8]|uniref:7TM domain-containing protein n=1 Tax=Altererythrobacter sp. GH1-8 TaxID=3349333 RepID=UPI00374D6B25
MFSDLIRKLKHIRERATPQVKRPFYIGLVVGLILAILVVLGFTNTGSFFALPSSFGGTATSYAIWGLRPSNLLMVLPLGAFLVVLVRSFVGLKAFGLFTPMLIALAFLQIGPIMGPIVLGTSILVGMILAPALLKLRMTRVGFLGVLISLIVLVLVALQIILDTELQVDAFPVVVCALCVERWWKQWEKDGPKEAAHIAFNTLVIAIVIQFVMVSHFALMLIEASPLLMPAFTAVAIAVLGRYRGLRITEIKRFAPIWLERRRLARANEQLDLDLDPDDGLADEEVEEFLAGKSRIEAAKERAPPLKGMWVINSPEDLKSSARRRVPQPRYYRRAQDAARLDASARPMKHNAWIIRREEDV